MCYDPISHADTLQRSDDWDLAYSHKFDHPFVYEMKCIDNDIKKYDLLCIISRLNWLPLRGDFRDCFDYPFPRFCSRTSFEDRMNGL